LFLLHFIILTFFYIPFSDSFHFFIVRFSQLPDNFCRTTECKCMWRDAFTRRNEAPSPDECMLANGRAIQNNCSHSYQGVFIDGGTVYCHLMPNGDIVVNDSWISRALVDHR